MEYRYAETVTLLMVILILVYYYLQTTFDYWRKKGVKGPKPIPIFGTVKDVMCGRVAMGSYLRNLYEKYPNESIVGFFLLSEPVVLLRDLDMIKDVLIKDFSLFSDRHSAIFEKVDPFSAHLFGLETARWRPLRNRLSPVFTSGKMKEMFHVLLKCGNQVENYLDEILAKSSTVECKELTMMYTVEVIGSFAFGIDMNTIGKEACAFREIAAKIFRTDMKTFLRDRFSDFTPWLYARLGYWLTDYDVMNFFIEITKEMMEYRRRNNVHKRDFLDALIDLYDNPDKLGVDKLTDQYVTAQAYVFFAAGYETSSATISNTLYELAQNQDVQDKLRAEISEMDEKTGGKLEYNDLHNMKYLDMVFKEVLRKYPVVMFLSRKSSSSYTFRDSKVTIPKGYKVFIPTYGIHHDPNIYPDPEKFDPNRFGEENVNARHPMSFLSFGNGPRNCIGARFATIQSKTALIKILRNHKFDVCEKTVIPYELRARHAFILQPKFGSMYLKVTRINQNGILTSTADVLT